MTKDLFLLLSDTAAGEDFSTLFPACAPSAVSTGKGWVRIAGLSPNTVNWTAFRAFCEKHGADYAFMDSEKKLNDFSAIFFDMDSTLVQSETLDEIAAYYGLGKECAAITAAAMSGEITDYAASLRARVALLKGKSAEVMDAVARNMRFNPGVEKLIAAAQRLGLKTFVTSSGFSALVEPIVRKLGMSGFCCNVLGIRDGVFTGEVSGLNVPPLNGTILDASGKAAFVAATMQAIGKTPADAICCGDGSNDVQMIRSAGLGVGFRPKAVLRPNCTVSLDHLGFDALLNLFADTRSGE